MNANLIGLLTMIVGVPLNLWVWVTLLRKSRARPDLLVLAERFVTASAILLLVTVFGLIFVNNDATPPWLDTGATKIITRLTMLLVAVVPAAFWLWIYRKQR